MGKGNGSVQDSAGAHGPMIDLHNHIIPGVDDGAADLPESLAIARQFVSEGIETVVATPHLDPANRRGIPRPVVDEKVRALQDRLNEAGVPLTILPGNEVFLTPEVPDLLRDGMAAPLAYGPWVLIELPFDRRPPYLEDTLYRIQAAGNRPILAHPERYRFVQADDSSLDEFVRQGLVLQLTAPSLLGEYGEGVRRVAETLLLRDRYGAASSDRHHPGPKRSLSALRQRIAALRGEQTARRLLVENPGRIVAGQDVVLTRNVSPSSACAD